MVTGFSSSRVAAILFAIVGVGLIGRHTSSIGPSSSLLAALGLDARNIRSLSAEKRIAFSRPLHVLSLGGSITWGHMNAGSNREDAYPFLLASEMLPPESTVTNIAVRGTGTDLAAMCLQTMVLDGHAEQNPTVLDPNGGHDIDYDIITVEYSINGVQSLDRLLHRLRQRYPRAVIIYIHLYNLYFNVIHSIRETTNPHQWTWRQDDLWKKMKEEETFRTVQQGIKSIEGAFLYELPFFHKPADALPIFADDFFHLNEEGHKLVLLGVSNLIEEHLDLLSFSEQEQDNGWGEGNGDQCISWYESGKSSKVGANRDFTMFSPAKYAMEVSLNDTDTAIIEINNPFDEVMPLGLSAMSHEKVYPKTKVNVASVKGEFAMLLDPSHRSETFRKHHVVQSHFVGHAEPGQNIIIIKPIEMTEQPLRVTGVVMCKDCGLEEMVPSEQE